MLPPSAQCQTKHPNDPTTYIEEILFLRVCLGFQCSTVNTINTLEVQGPVVNMGNIID